MHIVYIHHSSINTLHCHALHSSPFDSILLPNKTKHNTYILNHTDILPIFIYLCSNHTTNHCDFDGELSTWELPSTCVGPSISMNPIARSHGSHELDKLSKAKQSARPKSHWFPSLNFWQGWYLQYIRKSRILLFRLFQCCVFCGYWQLCLRKWSLFWWVKLL